MSEFHAVVFKIDNISPHPDADRLDIINAMGGYPCIVAKDSFKIGDLAIYVPIDTVLPNTKDFEFLSEKDRKHLKAKKLRGVFSMGLIIQSKEGLQEDDDVTELLGIQRWEPVDPGFSNRFGGMIYNGENEKEPVGWHFEKYTDIEGARKQKYANCFVKGEEVVITEKVHGQNIRVAYVNRTEQFYVGSRVCNKRRPTENKRSTWWETIQKYDLENKLRTYAPDLIFFGEQYGQCQDLKYGCVKDTLDAYKLAFFDVYDVLKARYLDYDEATRILDALDLPKVPVLYRGPWKSLEEFLPLAELDSQIPGANHLSEGWVCRPIKERWDHRVGRLILKLHGQRFLLRK